MPRFQAYHEKCVPKLQRIKCKKDLKNVHMVSLVLDTTDCSIWCIQVLNFQRSSTICLNWTGIVLSGIKGTFCCFRHRYCKRITSFYRGTFFMETYTIFLINETIACVIHPVFSHAMWMWFKCNVSCERSCLFYK